MHRGPKSRLALHVKSHYHYSLNNDIISNSEETVSLWKRLHYRCMHRVIASYITCLAKNPDRGFLLLQTSRPASVQIMAVQTPAGQAGSRWLHNHQSEREKQPRTTANIKHLISFQTELERTLCPDCSRVLGAPGSYVDCAAYMLPAAARGGFCSPVKVSNHINLAISTFC